MGEVSTVKITRPKVLGVTPRQRLFRLLDAAVKKRPVIWIMGPAGAGKTTLASGWIESRQLPCLWYEADEGDADLASFFYYMGLAAGKAAPRYKKSLPFLTPEYLHGVRTFTRRYFEELFGRLKESSAMVLDNFQNVPSGDFHEMIGNALETIPEGIHVIILSRTEPPPQLARLRANNKLALIGWDELSFTLDECRAFLKTKGEKSPPAGTVSRLRDETDGWAAGLVLMTEMAKKEGRYPLSGDLTRETVFHYFASQLFDKSDAETGEFLLKTSFFPWMTAAEAEQLTGDARAGALLSSLSRNHYFTCRRSLPAPSFQYHFLFREFLQSRARTVFSPEKLAQVLDRTAEVLLSGARIEDATTLFIEAGQWGRLIETIVGHAHTLVAQGKSKTLEKWIGHVPKEFEKTSSWLAYWRGICGLHFDPAGSRSVLEQAFYGFKSAGDPVGFFLSWTAVVNTFTYELGDFTPVDRWISELEDFMTVQAEFPSAEIGAGVAYAAFCALMYRQPHYAGLPFWEEKVRAAAVGADDVRFRALMIAHLSLYYTWWTGDEHKAAMMVEEMGRILSSGKTDSFTRITCYAFIAAYQWIRADDEACLLSVSAGLREARDSGIHIWDFVLLSQATWAISKRSVSEIRKHLMKMDFIRATGRRLDIAYYEYTRGWEAMCRGDVNMAKGHMDEAVRISRGAGVPFTTAFFLTGLAEATAEGGEYRNAESQLEEALGLGLQMKSRTIEYQYAWVHANLCMEQNDREGALRHLRRHLAVSRETGVMNHPCWRSPVMARLYAVALEEGIETEHVKHLIRKHRLDPPFSSGASPAAGENWPYPIRIYVLGGFEIFRDDELLEFNRKIRQKPLALLKALVALGGRDVAEKQLSDILWPDADGDAAHKSFEMTLLRLRRLLGSDETVLLKGGAISLDFRRCWVDAQAFEYCSRRAEDEWNKAPGEGSRETGAVVRLAEKALELYRGPFLPNDTDMECSVAIRERLRNRALQLIASLGSHWERAEQWSRAAEYYRRGIGVDDLFEDFYRSLMRCHNNLGQKAEAVRTYERCRRSLSSAFGIEPSAETQDVYRRIRRECNRDEE